MFILILKMSYLSLFLLAAWSGPWQAAGSEEKKPVLVDVTRIWDGAPHNAFTDLIRFKGTWYCVFREGKGHVSPDGALRVIRSEDGTKWTSAAKITSKTADLRDPKITVTPDGRLMLSGAGALHPPAEYRHQSMVWFSKDGRDWTEGFPVGEKNHWLWRITWHEGKAYGVGYGTAGTKNTRLYQSKDGKSFDLLKDRFFDQGYPNETTLLFQEDDSCFALMRRDGETPTAQLGRAELPYKEWTWKDLGVRIGGPNLIRLPDGRIFAAGRLYDGSVRTALCRLDIEKGTLEERLSLPSGGDTSYPGLVWHAGLLWMSYYSSHEGKTAIYLARIKVP
jgi:hypothetical protein